MTDNTTEFQVDHAEVKYPNKKHEEYKYCDVEKFFTSDLSTISNTITDLSQVKLLLAEVTEHIHDDALILVHVDGAYQKELSRVPSIDGLTVHFFEPTSDHLLFQNYFDKCIDKEEVLVRVNAKQIHEVLYINAAKNAEVENPIVCVYISTSQHKKYYCTRRLIVAEKKSKLHVVDLHIGEANSANFHNVVTEVAIEKNAKVNHVVLQNSAEAEVLVNTTQALQHEYSKYKNFTLTMNGQLVRNNTNAALDGEFIETFMYGLYLVAKKSVVDNHTLVDHRKPNCYSNELYKGVITDRGTGVFNGKVFVRQDAQKTNAYQSNKNILVSKDASVNTKPQLEIFADDVKCSHGTSTGKIDEEALFYLQSRGISKDTAKQMMLQAFIAEVSDALPNWALNAYISNILEQKLIGHEG
jgi:Fe-S cluster assembly protein SufD